MIPVHFNAGGWKEITCFPFDTNFKGSNDEWMSNTGAVDLVDYNCPSVKCAYFPGDNSRLGVPRFQAAFDAWREFSLSFWLHNLEEGPSGIITNGGCDAGDPPSLFVYGDGPGDVTVGMRTKDGHAQSVTVYAVSRNPCSIAKWLCFKCLCVCHCVCVLFLFC